MQSIGQRDLLIDETVREKYINPIEKDKERVGMFSEKTDIYLMAAIIGFQSKVKTKSKKKGSIRQAHEINEDQELLIYTIGYAETKKVDILEPEAEKRKELFRLVEEYANTGAPILHEMVMFKNDKTKSLEDIVWDKIKKINDVKKN